MLSKACGEIEEQAGERGSEDGIYLHDLADGAVLELETQHHHYRIEKTSDTEALISGHPTLCPEPVTVQIEGSAMGRPLVMPTPGYIGCGMHLVFEHPVYHTVTTSRIREIHKVG